MDSDYLHSILNAHVYDIAIATPLEQADGLSERLKNTVLLKREDLQPVHSFKLRGAYNKMARMQSAEIERGVVCASAGNHAQGVALAAKEMGIAAYIVMPLSTQSIKVRAVEALGGQVLLEGANYDAAQAAAVELSEERQLPLIHPFDDPDIIAGQGTIGLEIHRQTSGEIDMVFVPVGGGGLIAGIAAYLKSVSPEIKVIGVEPEDAASMHAALAAGEPVTLDEVGTFAEGVAVRRVGAETFRLCQEFVDEIVLVDNDEICAAIQDIFEATRAISEPAGALALAGLKRFVTERGVHDQKLVAVNSGANLNFDRLRHIADRAAIGEQREALFAVEIPEQPGSFVKFCEAIGDRNITEFNYRYHDAQTAQIFVGIELRDGDREREIILNELADADYRVIDISHNELAKLHIRYMVGGANVPLEDERVYRFRFPERPGALRAFLQAIGQSLNISLFHYRNHGSDYGRVLAGVQVPADKLAEFETHLDALGYPRHEETDNDAYRMFLT
jgi:threonine dehydratase